MFQMHAALLWTINDFPAYANLSGWSTKGQFACPSCNTDTQSMWLKNGGKWCYWGHRRFLQPRHKFRKIRKAFDGNFNLRPAPKKLSGSQIIQQLEYFNVLTAYKKSDMLERVKWEKLDYQPAKKQKKQARRPITNEHGWKKRSIFFELPYWEHNLIRHNLDLMHIEKNVCDNILFTLLGSNEKKSKDNLKARRDLAELGIRPDLHPQPRGSNLEYIPPATFTMGKEEKDMFFKVLHDAKFPDGYASNISRCVHLHERSIWGLKSHDNHVLIQQLLPIALRRVLPKNVVEALIELSNCFRLLCSKEINPADLVNFQDRISVTLCSLEKIFPPAFFDVMEHLPIHLTDELSIGGVVSFRWMYLVERYLHTLKSYVRNRAYPEASIAKTICVEECMTFCERYLDNSIETKLNRPVRNDDGDNGLGRSAGKKQQIKLTSKARIQAHRYVLCNTKKVDPFIQIHCELLRQEHPHDRALVDRLHHEHFYKWFKDYVSKPPAGVQISNEIRSLALGPSYDALRFKSYLIRGFRFRTKKVDLRRKTQNSGIVLQAEQKSYSSRKDSNPRSGDVTFYGQLTDIIEIHYMQGLKFVMFRCDWINNRTGLKRDEFNFTLVNFNHKLYKDDRLADEPFIFASQADQVWYVQDPKEPDWNVVVQMTPRDRFDSYSTAEEVIEVSEVLPFSEQVLDQQNVNHPVSWVRHGMDGIIVDTSIDEEDDTENDTSDED